jgi:branched-chain amino acid transport system permease protein
MKAYGHLASLVIIGFFATFPFTIGFISPYYIGVFTLVGIYIILAVGLDLLMGYAGQISVGHAAFFAIGAYTTGILTTKYGCTSVTAMLFGVLISGGIAWIIGRPVLALKEYYLAMATLAFNEIVVTLVTGLEWLTGGGSGLRDIPPFCVLGLTLGNTTHYYYVVWTIVLITIYASLMIVRSPYGLMLIAVHSDEEAASHFGINCPKYKTHVFVLASSYASVAGSLFAHYMGFIAPDDFGVLTSINVLVMLFLGGLGTIIGPALGALFLKILPEITYSFQDYQLLFEGAILVLVLVCMPRGIYGLLLDLRAKFFARNPQ